MREVFENVIIDKCRYEWTGRVAEDFGHIADKNEEELVLRYN